MRTDHTAKLLATPDRWETDGVRAVPDQGQQVQLVQWKQNVERRDINPLRNKCDLIGLANGRMARIKSSAPRLFDYMDFPQKRGPTVKRIDANQPCRD